LPARSDERGPASPLTEALDALRAPLEFVSRDEARHAERVRDLPRTLCEAAARVAALRIPRDLRQAMERLRDGFEKPLAPERRKHQIAATRARLQPFLAADWPERALERPPTVLAGIGPQRAALLERRGYRTVSDLLFAFPTRYDDRRTLSEIGSLEVGRRATFVADVLAVDFVPQRGRGGRFRRVLQAAVGDATGQLRLKWFHGGEALRDFVKKGVRLLVTGDVRRYRFEKEILHPDIEVLPATGAANDEAHGGVVPEYPAPEGVPARTFRRYVARAVDEYADLVIANYPTDRALPAPGEALIAIHRPETEGATADLLARRGPAFERLILEELFLLQLGLALRRAARRREDGIAVAIPPSASRSAIGALPFALTAAQQRVVREIVADLAQPHPMNRLLQGDVGSGKTAVAFLAARGVAAAGHQAALMAPTELLAEQHERTLQRYAAGDARPLRIARLTSSLARSDAAALRRGLAAGEIDLVVGTHALVQHEVAFRDLALAIVDEQHRFGVLQRAALAEKTRGRRSPHVLVMTATPIPRTLALTSYGELDVSVIDELPAGRQPVATHLLRDGEGARVMEAIRDTLSRGEQIYVVYPLVEASENVDLRAVEDSARRIARALPDARIGLAHGRLDAATRGETMQRFEQGELDLLVCTTVIEVGVDVSAATLIVIEHAERFGLAQLHQLRGRVGRGGKAGACLLVARGSTPGSEARLAALLETHDGFAIADADLRIRGPGEFLGTRQSGRLPDLRIADLTRDARLVAEARQRALDLVRSDVGLRDHPRLRRAVRLRWGERLALADVG